jgi:hypothetical protein
MKGITKGILWKASLGLLVMSPLALGAQVWESTFDAGADGVVDVVNGNLDKDLIGPAGGGTVQITTMDRAGAFNDNDRGGRALGATLDGNDSFSGYYKFQWADLNEDAAQMWESVGFIGNNVNTTRQHVGLIMRHWNAGGNYYVSMDMTYGEAGFGGQLFDAGGANGYGPFAPTAIFLGPNAEGRDLQLAIGYDGNTHVLTAELYDGDGNLMSGNSSDLDTSLVPTNPNTVQTMLDALQVTHLGWSEYAAGGGDRTTVWNMDTLTYFSDASGAFSAIVPEPASGLLLLAGFAGLARRRRHA